jgi:hypothetical protein
LEQIESSTNLQRVIHHINEDTTEDLPNCVERLLQKWKITPVDDDASFRNNRVLKLLDGFYYLGKPQEIKSSTIGRNLLMQWMQSIYKETQPTVTRLDQFNYLKMGNVRLRSYAYLCGYISNLLLQL